MSQNLTNLTDSKLEILNEKVRQLWYSILNLDILPDNDSSNFFTLGGTSLTFAQLFRRYQLDLAQHSQLNIMDFLAQPTIMQHIRLLSMNMDKEVTITSIRLNNATQGRI